MRGLLRGTHSTRRFCSANASKSTQQAGQTGKLQSRWLIARNAAVATAGAGTVAYSLLGFKLDSLKPESHAGKPSSNPTIPTSPSSSFVQSSVPALTVEEASARLRQGEGSLAFDAGDGQKGRFDYCRYACNSPVEDDYSFGSAEGAGTDGRPDWRYWGIYDGHAWACLLARPFDHRLTCCVAQRMGDLGCSARALDSIHCFPFGETTKRCTNLLNKRDDQVSFRNSRRIPL